MAEKAACYICGRAVETRAIETFGEGSSLNSIQVHATDMLIDGTRYVLCDTHVHTVVKYIEYYASPTTGVRNG